MGSEMCIRDRPFTYVYRQIVRMEFLVFGNGNISIGIYIFLAFWALASYMDAPYPPIAIARTTII